MSTTTAKAGEEQHVAGYIKGQSGTKLGREASVPASVGNPVLSGDHIQGGDTSWTGNIGGAVTYSGFGSPKNKAI